MKKKVVIQRLTLRIKDKILKAVDTVDKEKR